MANKPSATSAESKASLRMTMMILLVADMYRMNVPKGLDTSRGNCTRPSPLTLPLTLNYVSGYQQLQFNTETSFKQQPNRQDMPTGHEPALIVHFR